MEQLKAYALRKHFFRVLNEQGVEKAYKFLLDNPPLIDTLSKAYQDSKNETYLLQLNRLTDQDLIQTQNEISMLLMYAPYNFNVWNLFAKTFSDKKINLKQDILWFVANKRKTRYSYLQFVNAVRKERQWNLEAIYAQLKLIELSKDKKVHIRQVEFLTHKTFFELDYLSQNKPKVGRITTLFLKLIKDSAIQDELNNAPYFCRFCYFHLGDIKKALTDLEQNFNHEHQLLMINKLMYDNETEEACKLLETLQKNNSDIDPSLMACFTAQIKAAQKAEQVVKPVMLLLKRYPKRVALSLIEDVETQLCQHPNQPLVRACLKHMCQLFKEDQAILNLYMKSLAKLEDKAQGFEERLAIFKQAKTSKQKLQFAKELLLFSYAFDAVKRWETLVETDEDVTNLPLMELHQPLQVLHESQQAFLELLWCTYQEQTYESFFEQLSSNPLAEVSINLLYGLNPATFLVQFIPWWLNHPKTQQLSEFVPNQTALFEQIKRCQIESKDIEMLQEDVFLEEKLMLYLHQQLSLETLTACIQLKSCICSKETIVKTILVQLASQTTSRRFAIRYPLLKYLADWCATEKLTLTLARCCYRLKKYEEATSYFEQCQKSYQQREDIAIEIYISTILSSCKDAKVISVPSSEVLRQSILLLMGDKQFIESRTNVYLLYLKNGDREALLMWWYHLYRRLHQYELALGIIDQFITYNRHIYADVLAHFNKKLERCHDLEARRVLEDVKERLEEFKKDTALKQVIILPPFTPEDLFQLEDLMYEHDVLRNIPNQKGSFIEVEWMVEASKPKSWIKCLFEKLSWKSVFSKN